MKLSELAIEAINRPNVRLKLALGLSFSETWIRCLISSNKENGPLTTAKAIRIIIDETKIKENILLDESAD